MSKRFIDTAIINKTWFYKLTTSEKMAWVYITLSCDSVGVWEPNFEIANAYIGSVIDWNEFAKKCNGNIMLLSNGKWWICDFCTFQYGELSEESKANVIKSYIALLKRHGLWEHYLKRIETLKKPIAEILDTDSHHIVIPSPSYDYTITMASPSLKEKEKEKEQDKDKDKDKDIICYSDIDDIYEKERKKEINKEREKDRTNNADSDGLLHTETTLNGVIAYRNPSQDNSCSVSAYTNPQSIVKKSIEEESIIYNTSDSAKKTLIPSSSPDMIPGSKISKSIISKKEYSDQFLEFYQKYPRKEEKQQAYKTYNARTKEGAKHEDIMRALDIYLHEIEILGTEFQYIKLPSTFLNNYTDYLDPDRKIRPQKNKEYLPAFNRGMLDLKE